MNRNNNPLGRPQYNNRGDGPIYGTPSVASSDVPWNQPHGQDTVPAMLTPGEFVVNKEATELYGPQIKAINNAGLQSREGTTGGAGYAPVPMPNNQMPNTQQMGTAPIQKVVQQDRYGNRTEITYDTKATPVPEMPEQVPSMLNAGGRADRVHQINSRRAQDYIRKADWNAPVPYYESYPAPDLPHHETARPVIKPSSKAGPPYYNTGGEARYYGIGDYVSSLFSGEDPNAGYANYTQEDFVDEANNPSRNVAPSAGQYSPQQPQVPEMSGSSGVLAGDYNDRVSQTQPVPVMGLQDSLAGSFIGNQQPGSDESLLANSSGSKANLIQELGEVATTASNTAPPPTHQMPDGTTMPGASHPTGQGRPDQDLYGAIAQHEGFREEAYDDGTGVWTIGFGRITNPDGSRVQPGQTTNRDEEQQFLKTRVDQDKQFVLDYAKKHGYNWRPNQVDALTSFTYNIGKGGLDQLTAGGSRSDDEILNKLPEYNKAGGEFFQGLQNRRNDEAALFAGQSYGERYGNTAGADTSATPTGFFDWDNNTFVDPAQTGLEDYASSLATTAWDVDGDGTISSNQEANLSAGSVPQGPLPSVPYGAAQAGSIDANVAPPEWQPQFPGDVPPWALTVSEQEGISGLDAFGGAGPDVADTKGSIKTWTDPVSGIEFGVGVGNKLFYPDRDGEKAFRVDPSANRRFVAETLEKSGAQDEYIAGLKAKAQTQYDETGKVDPNILNQIKSAEKTNANIKATNAGVQADTTQQLRDEYNQLKADGVDVGTFNEFTEKSKAQATGANAWDPAEDWEYNYSDDNLNAAAVDANIDLNADVNEGDKPSEQEVIQNADLIVGGNLSDMVADVEVSDNPEASFKEIVGKVNPSMLEELYPSDGKNPVVDSIGKLFKGVFGDVMEDMFGLEGKDSFLPFLLKHAILYAGARATGLSGNAALAFAGKSAIAAGENKKRQLAARKAWSQKGLDPEDYTPESISKYVESGNEKDLVAKPGGPGLKLDRTGHDVYVGGFGRKTIFKDKNTGIEFVKVNGSNISLDQLSADPKYTVRPWSDAVDVDAQQTRLTAYAKSQATADGLELEGSGVNLADVGAQVAAQQEKILASHPNLGVKELEAMSNRAVREYLESAKFGTPAVDAGTFLKAYLKPIDAGFQAYTTLIGNTNPAEVLEFYDVLLPNTVDNEIVKELGEDAEISRSDYDKRTYDKQAELAAAWGIIRGNEKLLSSYKKQATANEQKMRTPFMAFALQAMDPSSASAQWVLNNKERIASALRGSNK